MSLTQTQLLEAVQYALNQIPNARLPGCPHGFRNSYELAAYVDRALAESKTK